MGCLEVDELARSDLNLNADLDLRPCAAGCAIEPKRRGGMVVCISYASEFDDLLREDNLGPRRKLGLVLQGDILRTSIIL